MVWRGWGGGGGIDLWRRRKEEGLDGVSSRQDNSPRHRQRARASGSSKGIEQSCFVCT